MKPNAKEYPDMTADQSISSDVFKQSMRLLAGGVCILATNSEGEWCGMTITAVCSLTVDPPSLVACVNRNTGTHQIMSRTKRMSINVLSNDQTDMAELFASSTVRGGRGSRAISGSRWRWGSALVDALAVLDCEVLQQTSPRRAFGVLLWRRMSRSSPERGGARAFQPQVLRGSSGTLGARRGVALVD
ncbi:MAG: flavin reductase [Rhizobiales bacterium]|nr:flavin reductase [Hyphomicrobiales bacterium]